MGSPGRKQSLWLSLPWPDRLSPTLLRAPCTDVHSHLGRRGSRGESIMEGRPAGPGSPPSTPAWACSKFQTARILWVEILRSDIQKRKLPPRPKRIIPGVYMSLGATGKSLPRLPREGHMDGRVHGRGAARLGISTCCRVQAPGPHSPSCQNFLLEAPS